MTTLRRRFSLALVLLAALGASPLRVRAEPRPITVFAAASLQTALDAAGPKFTAATGRQVRFSYGASSALARQVQAGAPADVFISADEAWMDTLAKAGLVQTATRRDLLGNRLVLVAPKDSPVRLSLRPGAPLAAALGSGRLAIAEPDVPAGRYGRAALDALGLTASVKERLAPASSVRAALAFVATGEAPLGIVYATDAIAEPKVRVVAVFPETSHPPIVYPGAVLTGSGTADAGVFLGWLQGRDASGIFRAQGFTLIAPPRR